MTLTGGAVKCAARAIGIRLIPPSCQSDAGCFGPSDEECTYRRCWGEYADSPGKPMLVQGQTKSGLADGDNYKIKIARLRSRDDRRVGRRPSL
jgi:hypothetical protein